MMKKLLATLLLCLLFVAACQPANPPQTPLLGSFDPALQGSVLKDVTYCTPQGSPQMLDVYFPTSEPPWRAVVFIHGGGWAEGDKADNPIDFSQAGMLGISINYRLYPDHRFPAMIEDVKCAIRFLRANASQLQLDPEQIYLIGASAGGHLAALAGLADASAGWDTGEWLAQTSRVQGVVTIGAPANLELPMVGWVDRLILQIFGIGQLAHGSPVNYVTPDDPPFLIIHGEEDAIVPVEQAYQLKKALDAGNVQAELVVVKHGGHGLEDVDLPADPPTSTVVEVILQFIAQHNP